MLNGGNGTFYRDMWEKVMLSDPQWVLITSFNEWHEGTEIEPSLDYGDLYLNLTKYYYSLFEAGRLTPRWERRMVKMDQMFSHARDLIELAESKGVDTRFMKRDYSIAENAWKRYDYEVAKEYVSRILSREQEIPQGTAFMTVCLLLLFGLRFTMTSTRGLLVTSTRW